MRQMEARDQLENTFYSGSDNDSEGESENGEDDDSSLDDVMSEHYNIARGNFFY